MRLYSFNTIVPYYILHTIYYILHITFYILNLCSYWLTLSLLLYAKVKIEPVMIVVALASAKNNYFYY